MARGLVSISPSGTRARLLHANPSSALVVASPDGSHVAYAVEPHSKVYVARADGGMRRRVADGYQPSWSPDGMQLVVVGRDGILKVASAAGGSVHSLGVVGLRPAWSPTGEWIAFIDRDRGRVDAIRPDGSGRRTIAEDASDQALFWSPSGGWLAFTGGWTGLVHLDLIRSDGSGRRTLADGLFNADGLFSEEPVWSPVDDRLAFRSWRSLRVQSPEGEPLVSVEVDAEGRTAWSPDGRFVAVGGPEELAVVDTRSGDVRRLGPRGHPHWSPDGTRLAYARGGVLWSIPAAGGTRRVVSRGVEGGVLWLKSGRIVLERSRASRWVIATVNPNGGDRRLVRVGPTRLDDRKEFAELRWSPDGSRIAYVRDPGKSQRLEISDARGGPSRLIATRAGGAAWSPDGKAIAYSRGGIWVRRLAAATPRLLTRRSDGPHAWSPNGRHVGFVRNGELYVVEGNGGRPRRLAGGGVESFSWSPDGRRIVFDVNRRAIAVIGVDGKKRRNLALGRDEEQDGWLIWNPRWSPEGSKIVYSTEVYSCGFECSELELMVMSAAGSPIREVRFLDDAVWSPDGSRLLGLAESDEQEPPLVTVDPLTGRQRVVAGTATAAGWQPVRRR